MNIGPEINSIQARIMRELFRHSGLRFADMNVEKLPSDQFSYHIRRLLKTGLVEKQPDGRYILSVEGRTRAIMLRPKADGYIQQGFIAVRVVLGQMRGDELAFLVQKRSSVPFLGQYATPGGKVLLGDDVIETARREMKYQTGLECDLTLRGITHIKDYYQDKIVQDKYFFVFWAERPRGKMLGAGENGRNLWLSYAELAASPLTHHGLIRILDIAMSDQLAFQEASFTIDEY